MLRSIRNESLEKKYLLRDVFDELRAIALRIFASFLSD